MYFLLGDEHFWGPPLNYLNPKLSYKVVTVYICQILVIKKNRFYYLELLYKKFSNNFYFLIIIIFFFFFFSENLNSSLEENGISVSADGSLVINHAQRKHHGVYTCTATNEVGLLSANSQLTVEGEIVFT